MSVTPVSKNLAEILVPRHDLDQWWRRAVIYQIYPRSFADGNGDGIGDFSGVIQRFSHLVDLGIDAIWFSPFYPSPQNDTGYDVSDYFAINPEYGTLEEFDQIVELAKENNIKIIIDVVPNHTSSQHQWFQDALGAGHGSRERDRYIFKHSEGKPPTNWGANFGGPAWSLVQPLSGKEEDKDWWYMHLFDPSQPDVNWDNQDVRDHFQEFFKFWMDRGVAGFRVDVANGLVKDPAFPDDHIGPDRWHSEDNGAKAGDAGPYYDQEGVHEIYRDWRKVLDGHGSDRMMVAEAWVTPPERQARYVREDEMSQAFNFDVLKCGWNAQTLRRIITNSVTANAAVGAPTTWVLSNHDVVRHATRFGYPYLADMSAGIGPTDPQPDGVMGLRRAKALTLFLAGLPGSWYIYQGEELGLPEATLLPDECREDPIWARTGHRVRGRDGCRVPLPWETQGDSLGFSASGKSWLPIPEDWGSLSASSQDLDPTSTLAWYRALIATRSSLKLAEGGLIWLESHPDVLMVLNGDIVLAVNMGMEAQTCMPGKVLMASRDWPQYSEGSPMPVVLEPNDAVWLRPAEM
ncbi:MAG: glycoside hydrolase family 13 protein [Actinomycetaceae bacterium]|nr:glycoside hydrolase family 13 protein [Actinomycetaceae bacterium]